MAKTEDAISTTIDEVNRIVESVDKFKKVICKYQKRKNWKLAIKRNNRR